MPRVIRSVPLVACAVAAQCKAVRSLTAQTATRSTVAPVARVLAPGVRHQQLRDPRGPWLVHVVRVDLRRAAVEMRAARAHDQLRSREKTTDMDRRQRPCAIRSRRERSAVTRPLHLRWQGVGARDHDPDHFDQREPVRHARRLRLVYAAIWRNHTTRQQYAVPLDR